MNKQQCIVRPTRTDLNPDELHYYPFIVSLDRCDASFNTVEHRFGRICVPNTTENVNLKVFNMIKGQMNQRHSQNISYVSPNESLMVEM